MLQPFAFGGEEGMESFDPSVKYRASLQNYLIDTGDEVILVDTDIPKEFPDMEIDEDTVIYNGERITDHMSALNELGYKAEDISKILINFDFTIFSRIIHQNIQNLQGVLFWQHIFFGLSI